MAYDPFKPNLEGRREPLIHARERKPNKIKGKWKAHLTSGGHMRDVAESDWKLFKKMLPQWQERYMEKLIDQYIEMLNGDSEASSRFWALEERLNRGRFYRGH